MRAALSVDVESAPDVGVSDELAPLAPRTLTVLFDISNKCNLRCRMCYFSYDSVFHRRAVWMSPETFEHVARTVLPLAHSVYLSAGSEPLTSPHFEEILRIAARLAPPQLKMLTNGILLTPAISSALIECGMTQLHVSIDGATKTTYEHIRRGGDFDRLCANLRELASLKREGRSMLPLVQFNVTLMRANLDELGRFVELALLLGVEQIACRLLMPYEGLEMEGESTSLEPLRANERFHAFLDEATRAGIRVTSFPDFYPVDGAPWSPPRARPSAAHEHAPQLTFEGDVVGAPFGRIDYPATDTVDVDVSIELAGWTLAASGVERVELHARADDDPSSASATPIALATLRNGSRPDVALLHRDVTLAYRSGWTCEVLRAQLPPHATRVHVDVVAYAHDGSRTTIGTRTLRWGTGRDAKPFLFCRKPFDNLYVDSAANVYPYPDCQTVDPFGSLAREESFREIWFGEAFRALRSSIVERKPLAMCLTCPDFINRNVGDAAFFAERAVERDFRLPTGFLDQPGPVIDSQEPTIMFRGWALAFAPITRIELQRRALPHEIARDGWISIATCAPGTEERADVAARHRHYANAQRAGFRCELARTDLPGDAPIDVRVRAWNDAGDAATIGASRVSFLSRAVGAFELPRAHEVDVTRALQLQGWALSSRGAAHVVVCARPPSAHEWIELGSALAHPLPRHDVAERFPFLAHAAESGWSYTLLPRALSFAGALDATCEIAAFAVDSRGERVLLGTRTLVRMNEAGA